MASESSAPARIHTTPVQLLKQVPPVKLALILLEWQWRVVTVPWNVFLYLLACFTSMLLRFLVLSGAPPADLVNREKVRELTNVVEHMHQREDQYRRKLQELQEEIDVRQREKKKVLVKLQRARGELVNYQEHLETVQQDTQQVRVQARPSSWGVHASCLLAALCVTWFSYQDYPALERKLAATICFPVFWIWVASLAASTPNHRITAVLYCTCWFLIGFVSCHKFHIC